MRKVLLWVAAIVAGIITFAVGGPVPGVSASGCYNGTGCTFYYNGSEYKGKCGQNVNSGDCQCANNNNNENQSACDAPPS
jgi:hypothetical protein